ncbi:MAG: HAD family hydrolase [Thermoproteota archaeon]
MHFRLRTPKIQGIKCIFMDVLGTIMDYSGYIYAGEALYNEFVSSFGINVEAQVLYNAWQRDWDGAFSHMAGYKTAKETWVTALLTTLSRFGARTTPEVLSELYDKYIQTVIRKTQIYTDATSEIPKLRGSGLMMGIISDEEFDIIESVLKRAGLYSLFSMIIVSDKVRGYKNKGEPFRHALRQTRFMPNEILYVGDSITRDIVPAKSAGLRTVLLAREGTGNNVSGVGPDYILPNLKALSSALAIRG